LDGGGKKWGGGAGLNIISFLFIEVKNKLNVNVTQSSGKGWLRIVQRVVGIAGSTAGILLAAPLKLPEKISRIAQYIALMAGIVKAIEKPGTDE
jgi:hypothetical protein